MESHNDNFLNNVEELIRLFNKLQDKAVADGILPSNDPLIESFNMLSKNFDVIRQNMPPELLDEIAAPIKDMVYEMIQQVKEELGEAINNPENDELLDSIEKIDIMLQNDTLSEDEINRLLDKRLNK